MGILSQNSMLQINSIFISLFCKRIAFVNAEVGYASLTDTLGNISRTIFSSKLFLFLIDLTIATFCINM